MIRVSHLTIFGHALIWSYQIRGALALFFRLTIGKDLIALCGADNKGIVTAGLDAIVDADIPIL